MARLFLLIAVAASMGCTSNRSASNDILDGSEVSSGERATKVEIGGFRSRGLWTAARERKPAILMLPGSGPQGPEEMIPASMSSNGQDNAVFNQLAAPFVERGFNVLQLGKPGVEFFDGWSTRFYRRELMENLTWSELLENAKAGLAFLRQQPHVDPDKIYILGHSQGTQVAVDVVATDEDVKGLILLGYTATSLLETVRWQLYDRPIEYFVKTDVDANHDGYVTRAEAEAWPEFQWNFAAGQSQVSIEEIQAQMASDPQSIAFEEHVRRSSICQEGHCEREPIYEETLAFGGDIYVFTGELDLQTPASEALTLEEKCEAIGRTNCHVEVVPGVQHSFNLPKPPRRHPLLDIAVAPVEESFQRRLEELSL